MSRPRPRLRSLRRGCRRGRPRRDRRRRGSRLRLSRDRGRGNRAWCQRLQGRHLSGRSGGERSGRCHDLRRRELCAGRAGCEKHRDRRRGCETETGRQHRARKNVGIHVLLLIVGAETVALLIFIDGHDLFFTPNCEPISAFAPVGSQKLQSSAGHMRHRDLNDSAIWAISFRNASGPNW